jgi:hypothetical protein
MNNMQMYSAAKANLVWLLSPFRGEAVRRGTAFVMLGIALPRLPFWPGPAPVYPLEILSGDLFGWLTLANAIALVVTGRRWRLTWIGRSAALVAFATWMLLAFATTSWTSRFIDVAFAWAMWGEMTAQEGRP